MTAHASPLSSHLSGALMVLVVTDDGGGRVQQRFVGAGGIEAACRALSDRPRGDAGPSMPRLRLLLAELCRLNKGWEARAHQAASDLSSTALQLAAEAAAGSAGAGGAGVAPPLSARPAVGGGGAAAVAAVQG